MMRVLRKRNEGEMPPLCYYTFLLFHSMVMGLLEDKYDESGCMIRLGRVAYDDWIHARTGFFFSHY